MLSIIEFFKQTEEEIKWRLARHKFFVKYSLIFSKYSLIFTKYSLIFTKYTIIVVKYLVKYVITLLKLLCFKEGFLPRSDLLVSGRKHYHCY